jgi:predicted metal-dependent phosphoesterase TrpH
VIPAIELSVNSPWGSLHLLGYFSDPHPPNVSDRVAQIQSFREERNPRIANRLQTLGIPINFDDVVNAAGGQVIGRPHFAKVLVEMGAVSSSQEAFDKYLKSGAPAYVDRERLLIQDAIDLIRKDNGVPVLAHPGLITIPDGYNIEDVIIEFKKMGGLGVEAYAPVHYKSFTNRLLEVANRYDMLVTGGTDFHGEAKPHLQPGSGDGNFLVPDDLAVALLQALGTATEECSSFIASRP